MTSNEDQARARFREICGAVRPTAMPRVDVLCQCGWGLLAVPESDVPAHCPVCGYRFITDDEGGAR